MPNVTVKRVYEPIAKTDGQRVLVDRIWPRGLRKEDLADAAWLKEIAPSSELRRWFAHKPERWAEFRKRYWRELDKMPETVAKLHDLIKTGHVTLLYSARDTEHNQAIALRDYLQSR
ncbi:MAG: DUF488 domain-containing protein [Alphaproteobacteria bacterium]|nr:DUF488 domain-containing protein [Alphaproteobacteria bacterium]